MKEQKCIHIIQPKINRDRKEFIKERDEIAKKFRSQKYAVIDAYEIRNWYLRGELGISLREIANDIDCIDIAETIVFAPNWQNDWACKIEREIAEKANKEIIDIN